MALENQGIRDLIVKLELALDILKSQLRESEASAREEVATLESWFNTVEKGE